jgi:hypothetical protein
VTDAELRSLLLDCIALWGVAARVTAGTDGMEIAARNGTFVLQRAPADTRPVRWLLHTPERRAAKRPPRAAPSIVALLTALRNARGAESGTKLKIGATAP